jgi:hypothetical protein
MLSEACLLKMKCMCGAVNFGRSWSACRQMDFFKSREIKNVLIIAATIIIIYNPGQGVAIFCEFSKMD